MKTDTKVTILNGFQQLLGEIYHCEIKQLTGGLSTNQQYLCSVNDKKYVARLLGESFSKRRNEVMTHSLAASQGIAPKIHYYDDEYSFLIIDFIEVPTLFLDQSHQQEVLDLVAQKIYSIARFNHHEFSRKDGWNLFNQIDEDYNKIRNQGNITLDSMIDDTYDTVNIIRQNLEAEQRALVFCHNDLHHRNIFLRDKDIIFIDWEIAGINYALYDVAHYSVFSCLSEVHDYYLLTQYLSHAPSQADLNYFKHLKLLVRCSRAFRILALLEKIPQSVSRESIKSFESYIRIFSEGREIITDEFLYGISIKHLQLFDEEYRTIERTKYNCNVLK